MDLSRRKFLIGLGGFTLVAAGCATTSSTSSATAAQRPGPAWPSTSRPIPTGRIEPYTPTTATPKLTAGNLKVIPRSQWTTRTPNRSNINPLNRVSRITIHHEGWKAFWDSDAQLTARRLESIRRAHVEDRGWADIGYHYVVDRSGRIWEARPIAFQGAHVKENNEGNLGILVLGNFDLQRPTDAQFAATQLALTQFMRQHKVPVNRVYTHQELNPTTCPGRNLQSWMVNVRKGNRLA